MALNKPFSEGAAIIVAAVDSFDKSAAKYVCTGVADDVDIQAAIDSLPASGGRVILLDGSYETVADITVPIYVTLEGQGKSTIIKPDGSAITQGIDVTGDHATIKNLKVEMQAGVGTGGARPNIINIFGVNYGTFKNLWVYGDNTVVDDGNEGRQCGLYIGNGLYNSILNVHSENNLRHGIAMSGVSSYNRLIGGCYENNVCNGVRVGGGANNNVINGGIYQNNTLNGCILSTSDENVVIGCQFHSNSNNGISIDRSNYITVLGNEITDNAQDGINITGDVGDSGNYNVVVGNSCYNNTQSGIEVVGGIYANYNTIKNNNLHGNIGINFVNAGNETDAYTRECDHFNTILAVTPAHVVTNEALNAGLPITFTIAAQPDVARTITWHFDAHANITAFTITIIGVNARGKDVSQIITEADGWDGTFNEAYATITSIIMSARTGTGVADTMDIGVGGSVGLSNEIFAIADVYKVSRLNADYSGAGNMTPEVTYSTVDLTTGAGIGGADDYDIRYLVHKNQVK